jgi:hypothetical protein
LPEVQAALARKRSDLTTHFFTFNVCTTMLWELLTEAG